MTLGVDAAVLRLHPGAPNFNAFFLERLIGLYELQCQAGLRVKYPPSFRDENTHQVVHQHIDAPIQDGFPLIFRVVAWSAPIDQKTFDKTENPDRFGRDIVSVNRPIVICEFVSGVMMMMAISSSMGVSPGPLSE
jgi:hypothetical protein